MAKKLDKETIKATRQAGGKRLAEAQKGVDNNTVYPLNDALKMIKERATAKFDETIEIAINLGIDPRQTDQSVRGVVAMPNGIGKDVRVAVIAKDDAAKEAKKAGAEVVGSDDLIEKIAGGTLDFDRCIATPDMMPLLGKVAKILGPRGLMPNPKLGTVTTDVAEAVKNAKSGQVEFKAERGGVVHAGIGKASFGVDKLQQNIAALVNALNKAKPSSSKGVYLKRAAVSSTMGVGIRVDTSTLLAA